MKQVDETGKKYTTDSAHPSFEAPHFSNSGQNPLKFPESPWQIHNKKTSTSRVFQMSRPSKCHGRNDQHL
jgi:hypothetical protein